MTFDEWEGEFQKALGSLMGLADRGNVMTTSAGGLDFGRFNVQVNEATNDPNLVVVRCIEHAAMTTGESAIDSLVDNALLDEDPAEMAGRVAQFLKARL